MDKIRSGGAYCTNCKKCITPPRVRKNFQKEWWTICEDCEPDVLKVIFRPCEDAPLTNFNVKFKHIPMLIKELERAFLESKHEIKP